MIKVKKLVLGDFFTNCYFLISEKESIIIDAPESEKILKSLKEENLNLRYIICTHYHKDHTLGVKKIREKTKCKVLIHEKEKEYLDFEPDAFLKDLQEISFNDSTLKIFHTPGHSPGSICVLMKNFKIKKENKEDFWEKFESPGFIFTGDTIFKNGIGRTDLPGGSKKQLKESLKKLEKILKRGIKVYPGHGEDFFF